MKYPYLGFDPSDFDSLYNPNRTELELRKFLAFGIAVANKQSDSTAKAMDKWINHCTNMHNTLCPFTGAWRDSHMGVDIPYLQFTLKTFGFGFYSQRASSFLDAYHRLGGLYYNTFPNDLSQKLSNMTLEELLKIKGVGLKTARFFLLYSRKNQNHAAIDTHIWKIIRRKFPDAPDKIPSNSKEYAFWEAIFIDDIKPIIAPEMSNAEFDFFGWSKTRQGIEI